MLNVLEVQDALKSYSQEQLVSAMQSPSAQAPQFLVLSELNRRKRIKDDYAQRQAQAQGDQTVAESVLAAAGVPSGGIAGLAQSMAPKTDTTNDTGATPQQVMPMPQRPQPMAEMAPARAAGGGYVQRMRGGGIQSLPALETGVLESELLTDPAFIAMANRQGLTVAELVEAMPPETRAAILRDRAVGIGRIPDRLGDAPSPMLIGEGATYLPGRDLGLGAASRYPQSRLERPELLEPYAGYPLFYDFVDSTTTPWPELPERPERQADDADIAGEFDEPVKDSWTDPATSRLAQELSGRAIPTIRPDLRDRDLGIGVSDRRTWTPYPMLQFVDSTTTPWPEYGQRLQGRDFRFPSLERPELPEREADALADIADMAAEGAYPAPTAADEGSDTSVNWRFWADTTDDARAARGFGRSAYLSGLLDPAERYGRPDAATTSGIIPSLGGWNLAALDAQSSRGSFLTIPDEGVEALLPPKPDVPPGPGQIRQPSGGAGAGGVGGSAESELVKLLADRQKRADRDKWMALAQAGFALMSSRQPSLGGAIGEAGMVGIKALDEINADQEARAMEMLKLRAALEGSRRGGGKPVSMKDLLGTAKALLESADMMLMSPGAADNADTVAQADALRAQAMAIYSMFGGAGASGTYALSSAAKS